MYKTLGLHQAPGSWMGRDGEPLQGEENIRHLNAAVEEIRKLCQSTLDEAVQMGVSENFVRVVLGDMMSTLGRSRKLLDS